MAKRVLVLVSVSIALPCFAALGCASILGFEDTTVLPEGFDGNFGTDGTFPGNDGSTSDAPIGSDGGGDSATGASLSVAGRPFVVRRGQSLTIMVALNRVSLTGDVTVRAVDLPTGVTASPATIASASSGTTVTLNASGAAVLGSKAIRFVADGNVANEASDNILVAGPPGTLDETFDFDGIVTDNASGNAATFHAVQVDANDRVLVGGSPTTNGGWTLRRYNADGTPDTSFNAAVTGLPGTGELHGIALDPSNGRVVAVGSSGATLQLTVVRRNANGSSDGAFGNSGTAALDTVSFGNGSTGRAVTVQGDSRVVAVGAARRGVDDMALLVRFAANGQTYERIFEAQNKGSFAGVALDPGEALVAGGHITDPPDAGGGPRYYVVRRHADGGIDTTLTQTGELRVGSAPQNANAMVRMNDGDYVLAGYNLGGPSFDAMRISRTGTTRWTVLVAGGNTERFWGAAAAPDNRVVLVGAGGGSQDKYARVEVRNSDGGLGDAGRIDIEDPATPDGFIYSFRAAAVDSFGRIIVVGNKNNAGYTIMRFFP